jgi:succinoglycan biosynthesis transport protein ExoP
VELLDYWRVARRNWLVLLASTLVGVILGAVYSLTQPTVYSATASAYVVAGTSGTTGDALAGSALAKDKATSYLPLVTSQQVATRIADDLRLASTDGIASRLKGSVVKDSVLFEITATSSTADSASRLADAAIRATAAEVQALETINPSGSATPTTVIKVVPVEQAATPAVQISPTLTLNLAVGPTLGLLAGFGIAIIRRALDRRVRTSSEAEELAGVGTLGIIPNVPELAGDSLSENLGTAAEALRLLRTNIRFVSVDHPPRSIVVTSANPNEGKSTVAAYLAVMLAQSGQPTILIDADLRRPSQAKMFDVDGAVGLTQVLARTVPLSDALVAGPHANLQLLPAGRIPPNPSELVGSERMGSLIADLAGTHTVIIDAPPVLAVTDAGLLTGASDGALLVIKAGGTFKEQVALCCDTFDKVGGGLLGTVLNLVSKKDLGSALYGYGYSSHTTRHYSSHEVHQVSDSAEPGSSGRRVLSKNP